MRALEINQNLSRRDRIMRVIATTLYLGASAPAYADESMTSIRVQACSVEGRGYVEQAVSETRLRIPRHLLTDILERVGSCENLQIGRTEMPLELFASLSENQCEADLELPDNVEDNKINDPHCNVPLSPELVTASGAMVLSSPGRVKAFESGSFLAMHDLDPVQLVVFQVRNDLGPLVTLEPIEGEVQRGDSGSALLPAFRNEEGVFEIEDYSVVATINGFYAPIGHTVPEGLRLGLNSLSNDWNDNVGVVAVRNGS